MNDTTTCPDRVDEQCFAPFLRGSYCKECSAFDEKRLLEVWHPVYFLVISFIHRFNLGTMINRNIDPVSGLIAAEIWLHNIGRLLERNPAANFTKSLADECARLRMLPKCNAYSLALSMGLPHQTVRRKILALIERGWVARSGKGELSITAAGEAEFAPDSIIETMREYVSTARSVFAMLDADLDIQHPHGTARKTRSRR